MCCGAGTQSIYLAKKGFDVTGIDISPTAIKIAQKRAKEEGMRVKFMVGNSFNLDFEPNSFDFVLDRGCFHHIPIEKRGNYIKGIHKVLRREGKYFSMSFSKKMGWPNENTFSLEDMERTFSDYFVVEISREVVHRQPDGNDVILNAVLMKKK